MATLLHPQKNDSTYTYSSQPRAISQREKYRDKLNKDYADQTTEGGDAHRYGNLMYDRRVIRGNTYSQHTLPATAQPDPVELQRQAELRRRALARKQARDQLRPRTPEAVDGRQHQDVQTELYLEELSDRIEEADVEVQTDAFLDRPPSPLFVPAKTGEDKYTQIEEGELFDFDLEVRPILEVLVGKTVEQSLLEVMEEEELANLRSQQRMFMELRAAELVEQQRLEEQERRHREEKERRLRQQTERMLREQETADRVAARAFAHSYLSDLIPTVFGTLAEHGYFYDPVERDVEEGFLPWLLDGVVGELDSQQRARILLDGLIREVVQERHQAYQQLDDQINKLKLAAEASKVFGGIEGHLGGEDADAAPGADDALLNSQLQDDGQKKEPEATMASLTEEPEEAAEENPEGDEDPEEGAEE